MKKILLLLLIGLATSAMADKLYIEPFSINYGEQKEIAIKLKMTENTYRAVQFDLYLPEGISIAKNNKNRYIWSLEDDRIDGHTIAGNLKEGGYFTIGIYSTLDGAIFYEEDGPLMYITIEASANISTGDTQGFIRNQNLAISATTSSFPADESFTVTSNVSTIVTTLGYASFSWPKALDFTNSELTAYIATSNTNNSLRLESVTKVPANTGLILKGTAGSEITYPLETVAEDDLDNLDNVSENMLTSNCTGDYTIPTNNVYVLSNLDDGKPGFYLAESGVVVGQYKSYLVLSPSAARLSLGFEEVSTGIQQIESIGQQSNLWYDLQGRRVQNPRNGVYMVNGKLRIIK
jgi:hypothetical protein